MRLLVCTKRDLHGARFLNRLLPALAGCLTLWLTNLMMPAEASPAAENLESNSAAARMQRA